MQRLEPVQGSKCWNQLSFRIKILDIFRGSNLLSCLTNTFRIIVVFYWVFFLPHYCSWMSRNFVQISYLSGTKHLEGNVSTNGPELLCMEQELEGRAGEAPHAPKIIWADKQQEMISKQEKLHKNIRIIYLLRRNPQIW